MQRRTAEDVLKNTKYNIQNTKKILEIQKHKRYNKTAKIRKNATKAEETEGIKRCSQEMQ